MKRRFFLGGLAATIAAPALVARASIMTPKVIAPAIDTVSGLQLLLRAWERWRLDSAQMASNPMIELIEGWGQEADKLCGIPDIYVDRPGMVVTTDYYERYPAELHRLFGDQIVELTQRKVEQAQRRIDAILRPHGGKPWL